MLSAAARAGRQRTISIVLGIGVGVGFALAALGLVAFVVPLLMHPPVTQHAVAALPRLDPSPPPLVEVAADSIQPVEPEPLVPQPAPIQIGPREASLEDQTMRVPAPWSGHPPGAEDLTALPTIRPPVFAPQPAPQRQPAPSQTAAPRLGVPPLPPTAPAAGYDKASPAPAYGPPVAGYDKWTAVYDIAAHTVYLPSGMRLEAHSGLGEVRDDPRFVDQRDRGPTPPHLYDLTLRESLFHGVQALRLTPVGDGFVFNRVGLLAHPYMLGASGDSNGCVSFKDYEVFLRAFQNGDVKHLAVVARLTRDPAPLGQFAFLRQGAAH